MPGLGTFPPHPYFICTIQTPIPDYAGVSNYGATNSLYFEMPLLLSLCTFKLYASVIMMHKDIAQAKMLLLLDAIGPNIWMDSVAMPDCLSDAICHEDAKHSHSCISAGTSVGQLHGATAVYD